MDQLQNVGKVLGGIKALMVLKYEITINQRQCCLLLRMFNLAFETISEEIQQNLRLEDKDTKWRSLENPLKELYRIFREGENYIQSCLNVKDWWGKAISLHQSRDCVEFHIHNLLCCFTVIIEALESAGEIYGVDQDDMQKRRLMLTRKYDKEWNDPKIFQWKHAKQYLVTREICSYLTSAWKEDRGILLEKVREKRCSTPVIMARHEQRLADYLIKKLEGVDLTKGKLLPAWILLGAKDYAVKMRLGSMGSHHKEVFWLGTSFSLRSFFGEINEHSLNEISFVFSLSHPNVVQYLCGFYDDERKEGFLLMEMMNECLADYVRENSKQRKKAPFSLPVAVDIMLQIARGMEYLHSKQIYHGDLNASNILLKARNSTSENYFHAKVTGFGLSSIKSCSPRNKSNQNGNDFIIWHAPELHPQHGSNSVSKYSEKADVYSFGMLCFEIVTGKTPFEEAHLQGDKLSRKIRVGERPLFPYTSPKFVVNLIKRCWQLDPFQRPSFSSICRILRYMKKRLLVNPDYGQINSPPLIDSCEIEMGYSKMFPSDGYADLTPVSQIPFQMFAYRFIEKEKAVIGCSTMQWDWAINVEGASLWGELGIDQRSVYSEVQERRRTSKVGADQRSVLSESQSPKSSSKMLTKQKSIKSQDLLRKVDRRISLNSIVGQGSVCSEIEEPRSIIDDHTSDGYDSTSDKKTLCSAKTDQVSGFSETEERKALPKDGNFVAPVQEMNTSKIAAKQNFGSYIIEGRKLTAKQKAGFVRDKSHPCGVKTRARKTLTPIQSDDSELGSITPEHVVEKRVLENSSDQSSGRPEIVDRKLLAKERSLDSLTSASPGRGLSPISSQETDKGSSSTTSPSPSRANLNLAKIPKVPLINRFQGRRRASKTSPWT